VAPDEAHWLVELLHARDPRVLAARDVSVHSLASCSMLLVPVCATFRCVVRNAGGCFQVFASGRDEEELRDTLTHIAKLAATDVSFQQRYGVEDDTDGDTAAAAAPSVPPRHRALFRTSGRSVIDLLERVFAAPCESEQEELSSQEITALVSLARFAYSDTNSCSRVFHVLSGNIA
jgi:hypothetical protein